MNDFLTCSSCGAENPGGFRFCGQCTAPLTPSAHAREERKVVTTLFCDLVGFTAMSEASDPEDVDALLGGYFAHATKIIESHGGTVEKFIGDAVVGVFGVPAVREDDPERAVRAGLRLIEALEGMTRPDGTPLQARVGINTGEALVRLDVDPSSGRGFVTGDAVNTAARLEAAAPPGRVVVGQLTQALTRRAIVYEELEPLTLKGKKQPQRAWLARAPREARSRTGLRTTGSADTPFVGREKELAKLLDAFDKAALSHQAQFVLLVGEPGIGKSRLVLELARTLDQRPELVTWRQGRCPGYGEAVTFWALGEIVKTHGGILDSDEREAVEDKLEAVLPTGDEKAWLRQRLRPLLGLEASQASREENFAAWRRFLEIVATPGPAVIVLEDMHWADDALLDFTEYLGTEGMDAPVLVLAPARPELTERRPHLLAPRDDVSRLVLHPLAQQETKDLLAGLLQQRLSEEAGGRIAERVGGNPLYVEEYARLLVDRGLARVDDIEQGGGRAAESDGLLLPDTVQAVIAARLDALPPARKALLCDAAVIGEMFWLGAVASLARRSRPEVGEELQQLADAELLRQCHSSIEGETAYLFWHALTRDVAYAELPRKIRAVKHAGAAQWIEQKAGERRDDHAETLAYQYLTAFDLARAASEVELAESLRGPAIRSLGAAADRTLLVDLAAAERFSARGLELAGHGPERLPLLASWGGVLHQRGLHTESAAVLRQAVEGYKAKGDRVRAGRAAMLLSDTLEVNSGVETLLEWSQEAVDLLDDGHPSVPLLQALSGLAWIRGVCGDEQGSIEAARQSIARAKEWGMPVWPGALGALGAARLSLGDLGGLTDYERALEAARYQGLTYTESVLSMNLGFELMATRGPAAALQLWPERLELDRQRGFDANVRLLQCSIMQATAYAGRWDEALALADELGESLESSEDLVDILTLGMVKALVLLLRGDPAAARRLVVWAHKRTPDESPREALYSWRLVAGVTKAVEGDAEGAVDFLTRLLAEQLPPSSPEVVLMHPHAIRAALRVGDPDLANRLVAVVEAVRPFNDHVIATGRALLAESAGELDRAAEEFADAAARWHDFGVPYEEAQALLGQGRCLVALDRGPGAAAPLHAAREIFARLGASPALEETQVALAAVR